jgi:hypothetical protein
MLDDKQGGEGESLTRSQWLDVRGWRSEHHDEETVSRLWQRDHDTRERLSGELRMLQQ